MHHTAAFTEATAAAVVNSQINALTDGVIPIRNNNFFPVTDYDLIYAIAFGVGGTNARLDSPTLRQISRINLSPLALALVAAAEPRVVDYTSHPLKISTDEELELQISNSTAIGERITGVIGLQESYRPTPPGRIYTIRATSVTAATANAWSTVTLTYDDNLPSGRYAVVGAAYVGANGQAFRLNLNEQKPNPGGIANVAVGDKTFGPQRFGGFGVWGEFDNTALPELEVLCNGATAAHTLFLDIVKIR